MMGGRDEGGAGAGGHGRVLGSVVIGRNEGERLKHCLESVLPQVATVVYVDSGSADGSAELARSMGAEVIELDASTPFTAARARNEGLRRLRQLLPGVSWVQFVDGDCRLAAGWIEAALPVLGARNDAAAVSGALREARPEASVWNRLCDLEWRRPVGEIDACGGIALMRVEPLVAAGGFNPGMAAGEEPELCARLRTAGWKILHIEAPMATHDAAMTRFGQWWRRSVRSGHAYAEQAWLQGRSGMRSSVRQVLSILFWGLVLPMAVLGAAWPTRGLSLGALLLYLLLRARVRRHRLARGEDPARARLYASFCVLAKFPQVLGVLTFVWRRLVLGRGARLIEYKGVGEPEG